jgi:hypothetical protein
MDIRGATEPCSGTNLTVSAYAVPTSINPTESFGAKLQSASSYLLNNLRYALSLPRHEQFHTPALFSNMAVMIFHRVGKISRSLFLLVFVFLVLISVPLRCGHGLCGLLGDQSIIPPATDTFVPKRRDVELVVGKLKREDTTWVAKFLPDWPSSIYVVDDPNAELTVAMNKGREAMVYLTCVSTLSR